MSIIQKLLDERCGFVTDGDIRAVVAENSFQPILIRCGNGRFTCPAQDVEHFVNIINKSENEYVRDVSIIRG